VIDNLARGLTAAGHEVELFTIGDSPCPVTRSWLFQHPVEPMGDALHESLHVEAAYRCLTEVDVIHDHTTVGPLLGAHAAPPDVPVVTTAHGPFTAAARQYFSRLPSRVSVVAISHPQRASAPDVRVTAVIPHGIDTQTYLPGPGGGGYLAFVGRMSPDKGVHDAIDVARRAGLPLTMMVKMRAPDELAFFHDVVEPMLGRDIQLLIEPEEAQRIELLGRAEALINPIAWPEPFGLVMAEALACGTPVIARPFGAAQEIVEHRRTGYLHDSIDDLADAVRRIDQLDRCECRAAAEQRFSRDRMVEDHIRLYRQLLHQPTSPTVPTWASPHNPEASLTRQPSDRRIATHV
jgi:glycosyltransferase involved in cell wall biosynthesis